MSDTVFNKVDYTLGSLVNYIGLGEIGLPDIQRPFVWKNAKVRDLFDSMYRGYPVGYLLFWQSVHDPTARAIGTDSKQKPPRLVIVDGQQRLTSLYAVIKNVPVLRENFGSERIQIAFNPLEERFEVADAAIRRDKAFLPDISVLWSDETDLFEVVENYLEGLGSVSDEDRKSIRRAVSKVQGLQGFPFTALELASDVDEEAVSDVFVRINSKGTPLIQSDFILTLMSVFWDEGRAALERFCREARVPAKGGVSPYNHFIEPSPDQLLRVAIGVAFKRARLQYVYSILRGKDLETGTFSEARRVEQFGRLKDAQARTLNLQHWHDFMNCVRQAGFRGGKMISSQNSLLFSYMLYLIGRTEYRVPEPDLRRVIARWFFMSGVTGRFTSSPESAMEFDLARLRDVADADGFVRTLNTACEIALTDDFWKVSLPNDLATSSPRSPSLFAYYAALVLLGARALFSKINVAEFLSPAGQGGRAALERHHLFPKAYLGRLGVTETRDVNQIANYAPLEWGDNARIADKAPADYLPELTARLNPRELRQAYHHHALPEGWEGLEYRVFLERRRDLMARVILEGYKTLIADPVDTEGVIDFVLARVVTSGESETVEYKSTLRTNLHTGQRDARMELAVLKTLAGFLNTSGGTLVVGVADDGEPLGLGADGFENEDKMALHFVNIVKSRLGVGALTNLHPHFEDLRERRVMVVRCRSAPTPVFVKDGDTERFYVRTGPSTTELSASQTQSYLVGRSR